jgi:small GTP-binding protein domain
MQNLVIGIFGKRNAGKSTLANMLAGQQISIVSETAGTTTDPVRKRMEITGLGPCTIIDTAGTDDEGGLGAQRVAKSLATVAQVDIAIVIGEADKALADALWEYKVPTILAERTTGREELLSMIAAEAKKVDAEGGEKPIFEGIISEGETVILVCPIDSEAPQGRLILPQVNAIRDLLDRRATAIVLQPSQLEDFISRHPGEVSLVVTDSQIFKKVAEIVPESIPLTSFSMLLARSKGDFEAYKTGIHALSRLKDGDRILILESCTHTATCEDIGRVKLPAAIRKFSGRSLDFDFVSGLDEIKEAVSNYAMVIQCGGCMVTSRQLHNRLKPAMDAGVPVVNYGMALAFINNIYDRSLKPLL